MADRQIIVVGGGAAGLMAAGQAALAGAQVVLLEKMSLPGRKLGITGKGRCNLTNVADLPEFIAHFGTTGPFLEPAFAACFAPELMAFFQGLGVPLVTERGGRVFPAGGKATDVTRALHNWVTACGVTVRLSTAVTGLTIRDGAVHGVVAGRRHYEAECVILATGGASYPRTGSTGDGYALAKSAGHHVVPIRPALVPLEVADSWIGTLSGLEMRHVRVTLTIDDQPAGDAFGEMSFTDSGVTGPIILTLSGRAVDTLRAGRRVALLLDLKPALSNRKLAARLQRDMTGRSTERLSSILRGLLPRPLVALCLEQTGLSPGRTGGRVSANERQQICAWLKGIRLQVSGTRPIAEAIVTAGGVDTHDITPATMESRKVRGLFIAGELLDIQADTGGYNLQAAFATGWLAGQAAARPWQETRAARPDAVTRPGKRTGATAAAPARRSTPPSAAFLPTTPAELQERGWNTLDVILVTGDSYIDSPYIGVALIGRVLEHAGYRVGIIAQPDVSSGTDITRLGEPRLFWGVTAGCIDSMVANRTASGKKRKQDDYTPGGMNNRRPDRATLVYSNLIRQHFKQTRPIVLGGIEASLRRIPHYDFWSNKIRRSILFDAKADYLLYGMAEQSVVELAACLEAGDCPRQVRGLCYISRDKPGGAVTLPPFADVAKDKDAFTQMFHRFYRNNDPVTGRRLAQQQDTRYLVINPPPPLLNEADMDALYALDYARDQHPFYQAQGDVRALETIRCSIATHRGCYGECNFCAIAVHEGRTVQWRSEASILAEAATIAAHPAFKGTLRDVGGPTANMYGFECPRKARQGACPDKRCVFPTVCTSLPVNHQRQRALLTALRGVAGVRQVVIASGIRHDLVLADEAHGTAYLQDVVAHHVSGQMRVAPEHSETAVLKLMGKPGRASLLQFRTLFMKLTQQAGKPQFLTYYLIAAHPGCTLEDMARLRQFAQQELKIRPRQVQIFTPTPSTYATLMYWTERDPFTGKPIHVDKSDRGRERQKATVLNR